MKQWEYDKEYISPAGDLGYELQERGEDGWEAWHLKQEYDRDSGGYSYVVYYKRKTELNVKKGSDDE